MKGHRCNNCSTQLPGGVVETCPECGATIEMKVAAPKVSSPGGSSLSENNSCAADSELRKYLMDGLTARACAQLEEHVEQCEWCEQRLARMAPNEDGDDLAIPRRLGRYVIQGMLGRGGFGLVLLAYDEELDREVAIKIALDENACTPEDLGGLTAEARNVAALQHPRIVSVYDIAQTAAGQTYIVSQYIPGQSLAERMAEGILPWQVSVEMVADVAEALNAAHQNKVIHRDIKPANILLDEQGAAYLADFGIALREADFGNPAWQGGTPGYLSPEQARGEGHDVDGRSDIFSLGVVFYELLTGHRPFQANDVSELLDQVRKRDAAPPRQWVQDLPPEVETICLQCLEKEPSDRFATGAELAAELRAVIHRLEGGTQKETNEGKSVTVVPHGLRPFDASDGKAFLSLLPGPYNTEGVPEAVLVWARRLMAKQGELAPPICVLYGPSGCGKTSFVRAGVCPQISPDVQTLYLAADQHTTEERLLEQINLLAPAGSEMADLVHAMQWLRTQAADQKRVIVLDQFEQWLQGRTLESKLVDALRICNGTQLQGLIIVRDEYWMAITRLMHELEVEFDSNNCGTLDRFESRHAEQVLTKFGQAFGALPSDEQQLEDKQSRFIEKIVAELADQDGRVIPVQLALLADIVKGKAWDLETLDESGGLEGMGVRFLEDSFQGHQTPPQYRKLLEPTREVLRGLLPRTGSKIRTRRSWGELFHESGCRSRDEFQALMIWLDRDLRLIAPVENRDSGEAHGNPESQTVSAAAEPDHEYQLTHEYLSPILREWLFRQDLDSYRGRARRLLVDREHVWQATGSSRHLPSLSEWLKIVGCTRSDQWTRKQRQMLASATRHHLIRLLLASGLMIVAILGVQFLRSHAKTQQTAESIRRLRDARPERVAAIIEQLVASPVVAGSLLESEEGEAGDAANSLWIGLANARVNGVLSPETQRQLLEASPEELFVVQQVMSDHWRLEMLQPLNELANAETSSVDTRSRLRAASIVSFANLESFQLNENAAAQVSRGLVETHEASLPQWLRYLKPHAELLSPMLLDVYLMSPHAGERQNAADALLFLSHHDPEIVTKVLVHEDDERFQQIVMLLLPIQDSAAFQLASSLDENVERLSSASHLEQEEISNRMVRAALGLLALEQTRQVWPLLIHEHYPQVRAKLIDAIPRQGVNPRILSNYLLTTEGKPSIRSALLLSLGDIDRDLLPMSEQQQIIEMAMSCADEAADPGLASAAAWLLRRWGTGEKRQSPRGPRDRGMPGEPGWIVAGDGQMMVTLGPAEFVMGTPADRSEYFPSEVEHVREIPYRYALATTEVTVTQYEEYLAATGQRVETRGKEMTPEPDCPQTLVSWFEAARYCNWLSEREGLAGNQWCYLPNRDGEYQPGMQLADDSLQRLGYRLPTEAEWEFASRAGTATSRFHGDRADLLPAYGWFQMNSEGRTWPVGLKKPNPLGFFDLYGNALEWCHDHPNQYDQVDLSPQIAGLQAQRGGHVMAPAHLVRSAIRYSDPPQTKNSLYGFRVAKTILLIP